MSQAIQVRRFNNLLGRLLSMSGVEDPAGQLSPEISPVLSLEADRPEWKFLAGDKMCSATQLVAASIGNRTVFRFRNPATSGQMGVLESAFVSTPDVGIWTPSLNYVAAIAADRAVNAGAFAPLDSRWGASVGTGAILLSGDNVPVTGVACESGHVLSGTRYFYQCCPIVLFPGAAVEFYMVENNVNVRLSLRWRERPFEPYEQV